MINVLITVCTKQRFPNRVRCQAKFTGQRLAVWIRVVPIGQATSLSTDYARNEWQKLAALGGAYTKGGILQTEIDFDLLPEKDADLSRTVKQIGGTLDITPSQVTALRTASRTLLLNSACFRRFVAESGATAPNYDVGAKDFPPNGWPYGCEGLNEGPH